MSKTDPSPQEQMVLELIRRHAIETGNAPTPQWLAEQMEAAQRRGPGTNQASWQAKEIQGWHKNVLTIIGRLERKGLTVRHGGRPQLTALADSYFASLYEGTEIANRHEVIPATIPVRGRVKAGRGPDLNVDISSSTATIPVPDVRQGQTTYALEVEGTSMEHEGIRSGDYVIVEEFGSDSTVHQGELIVTRYLEWPYDLEDNPELDILDLELSGPTLKYYYEVRDRRDHGFYRLGWKKDNNSNMQMIKAARVEPIGRVIGMYRRLRTAK